MSCVTEDVKMLESYVNYFFNIHNLLFICRIQRLAQMIREDYGTNSVTLLCVLKGGFRFCQDLMNSIAELNRSSGELIFYGSVGLKFFWPVSLKLPKIFCFTWFKKYSWYLIIGFSTRKLKLLRYNCMPYMKF